MPQIEEEKDDVQRYSDLVDENEAPIGGFGLCFESEVARHVNSH